MLLLYTLLPTFVTALAPNCPVLGSSFPPITDLSNSNPIIQAATANLTDAITKALSSGNTAHGPFENTSTSFSVQIFTTHSEVPVYDFHHTSPTLQNSTTGTKKVDGDSVYRIGSLTKLFTVFAYLIEAGEATWYDPVTKWVPELKKAQEEQHGDAISFVQWDEVSLGALASQMSGIGRDYYFKDILTWGLDLDWQKLGLPAVNLSDTLTCTTLDPKACPRQKVLQGIVGQRPVFASFSTPVYSNIAYQILSYAIEAITNKTVQSIIEDRIFDKLDMTSSSYVIPVDASKGVIPVDMNTSWWNFDLGDESPAGSIFSSTNDLAKAGRGILKSTLLTPVQTRRWMKPSTHTAKFGMSVGAPWEIRRYVNPQENRIIDVYTKGGDVGAYSSILALIPEYDLGFAILAASEIASAADLNVQMLSEIIAETFLPELEKAGRAAANERFAGTYTDTSLNSTVSLSVKDGQPGLYVDVWTSKGVDVLQDIALILQTTPIIPTVVVYPTTVFNDTRYAFRADIEFDTPSTVNGVFSWEECSGTWVSLDGYRYAGRPVDDFVFHLRKDGKATSLEPRLLNITLPRET